MRWLAFAAAVASLGVAGAPAGRALRGASDEPRRMSLANHVGESSRPQPNCSIIVDRHNHKTGGTTMRDIFLHNMHAGACLYWGYGAAEDMWERFLAYLEANPPDGSTLFRMCIEAHYRIKYFEPSVPRLAAVREAAAKRGCTVTLVTRVREPLSFYLSYYRWTIMGRQLAVLECERARAHGAHRSANMPKEMACTSKPISRGPGEGRWGRDFMDWARRTPNLQSRLLLDAGASSCVEEPARPCERGTETFGAKELDRLFRMLEQLDVVGTTEAFDEHLLLVQQRTGLPDVRYAHNTPKFRYLPPGEPPLPLDHPSVCANRTACAALVQAVAPYDHELYARFGAGFGARVAEALGGEPALKPRLARLRERLRALEAFKRALNEAAEAHDGAQLRRMAWLTERRKREKRGERGGGEAAPVVPEGPASYQTWTRSHVALPRVCRQAKDGKRSVGGTPCMPVPPEVAKIWQDNLLKQRPRSGRLQSMQEDTPSLYQMQRFAAWARGHRELVEAAELPVVPRGCPDADRAAAAADGGWLSARAVGRAGRGQSCLGPV